MGESSFTLFSVSALAFLGFNYPTEKDCSESSLSERVVDESKWVQVDFFRSILDDIETSCKTSICIEKSTSSISQTIEQLDQIQGQYKPGWDSIERLSEGQRKSLINFYRDSKEQGEETSMGYRQDLFDACAYRQIEIGKQLLHLITSLAVDDQRDRRLKEELFEQKMSLFLQGQNLDLLYEIKDSVN